VRNDLGGSADTHPGEEQDMQDGSEKNHEDDLPYPDDSLDLEYLNSPRSQSTRSSGSSSEDVNARLRIENQVNTSRPFVILHHFVLSLSPNPYVCA